MLRTGYRFLIFLLFLYTGLIFLPYFFCKGSVSSFMSTWVAVVGGSILLWYTWETLLIRKIANSQRELSIQPLVVFKNSHGKYEIENIGNGVALNVSIDSIFIGSDSSYPMKISFPTNIAVLRVGASEKLEPEIKLNDEIISNLYAAHLNPTYANQQVEVSIRFSNVEGKIFNVMVEVAPNRLSIKRIQNILIS